MKKIVTQLKKFRLRDVKPLILIVIAFLPGKIYQLFYPKTWIVTEYKDTARDNGYWLFEYIKKNHPEQKVFYPIDFQSADYHNFEDLDGVIKFGGFFHYILFWGAEKFIGTTKYYGLPYGRICEDIVFLGLTSFKYVFLNHGVARGYSSIVDANETNYQLIISMSEQEKDILIEKNGQNREIIKTIGFCRHDNLNNNSLIDNQILIMPTWRNWLDYRLVNDEKQIKEIKKNFLNSSYYQNWQSLLNNEILINYLEKNDINVIFYLHEYAQIYSKYFESKSKRIKIGLHKDYLIQDLLKSSVFLITDYSSVTYDFCYMNKSMAYYQFDKSEFDKNQYSESDRFTYKDNGFGPVFKEENKLVNHIIFQVENNYNNEEKYSKRIDSFYANRDNNNCLRNYEEILNL